MAPGTPNSKVKWLAFPCPSCKTRLRIKAAFASLRGRCPECGSRIEPLRPAPPPPRRKPAAESFDLVPVEDEWPEPAQLEALEEGVQYDLASGPEVWEEPAPPPPPRGPGYALAEGDLPDEPKPAIEPVGPAFRVREAGPASPRDTSHLPDAKEVEKLLREPPPPPPKHPLWSGIYTFPFRQENLGVWFFLALNLSLLAVLGTAMLFLLQIGGVVMIGVPLLIPLVALAFFWTGMYASGCFLALVEDTAAGNDKVTWPQGGGLVDGLGRFFFLLWLAGCGFLPILVWWAAGWGVGSTDDLTWVLAAVPGLVVFPVELLSALTVGTWWALLDGRIVVGLLRKPHALALLCIPSLLLMIPCLLLTRLAFAGPSFLAALGAGLCWSAFLLIYGRLLGRAGWILIGTGFKKKSGKKKPPRYRGPKSESVGGWDPDEGDDPPPRRRPSRK